jgi:preprotein translocase subunit SecF
MNIIKRRYIYFAISLVVIVPGVIALFLWGLPLAIDFTGGSLLEIRVVEGSLPTVEQVARAYEEASTSGVSLAEPLIQPLGEDGYAIRSREMDDEVKGQVVAAIEAASGAKLETVDFSQVSAAVGSEVAQSAAVAVAVAAVAILLYITYAFRGVEHSFRYGTAAIIAMLHDILVVVGVEALLGHFFGWQTDALFLTALLTVIGFSVHDTIVVFDRVRENSRVLKKLDYETMVNHSIVQTLDRSINTQLTVLITLFSLILFGGESIQHFVIILVVGILSGTYSSIFNAAPILVVWENREWRTWFRRDRNAQAAA